MAIVADHYRQEQDTLAADPIIIAMERELPASVDMRSSIHSGLMQQALREYHKRGGTRALSIGGPLAAMKLIRYGEGERL